MAAPNLTADFLFSHGAQQRPHGQKGGAAAERNPNDPKVGRRDAKSLPSDHGQRRPGQAGDAWRAAAGSIAHRLIIRPRVQGIIYQAIEKHALI
jgi:hypothetical protein